MGVHPKTLLFWTCVSIAQKRSFTASLWVAITATRSHLVYGGLLPVDSRWRCGSHSASAFELYGLLLVEFLTQIHS